MYDAHQKVGSLPYLPFVERRQAPAEQQEDINTNIQAQ
jgi:hypothetical protein